MTLGILFLLYTIKFSMTDKGDLFYLLIKALYK